MDPKSSPWPARYSLKTCAAAELTAAIPAGQPGIAVVYTKSKDAETVFLVLDSRAGSLRDLCEKRLATAKIPAGTPLTIAFKIIAPADASPESVSASCREQVIAAGELRRELRPAMR